LLTPLVPYMTRGVVNGVQYLFDGTALYEVTNGAGTELISYTDVSGTLLGVTAPQIICIAGSFNYLIIATELDNRIHWSSTTTAVDFVDSLVTGAGSISVNNLVGKVRFIKETPQGFNIYTTHEVIFAQYTGNARYPWKFTPVANADGFLYPWQVASAGVNSLQYALSNAGKLYAIQGVTAEPIGLEVATYIERTTQSDVFNQSTNVVSRAALVFTRRIYLYLKRYVLIEHTIGGVKYFLVFDTLTQRYGKIKQEGYAVNASSQVFTQASMLLYFLNDFVSGNSYQLSADIDDLTCAHAGVLLLGKFQYVRSRFINMHEVELEGSLSTSPSISCALLPSLDGRNFNTPVPLVAHYQSGGVSKFYSYASALNYTVVVKGRFDLSTLQLRFSVAGDS